MRIIHSADLHIGAKVKNVSEDLSKKIKANLSNSFKSLVEYAINNNINVIMLSGDVFDSDKVNKSDKVFFYDVIKANPSIDFIYLKGNHDSNSSLVEEIDNLKVFNDNWTTYEYDNVAISGVELTNTNYKGIYSALKLDKEKFNIVMLHGNDSSSEGIQDININKLKNKNINYLALGHIHAVTVKEFEEKHELVYPGCLTSHGFDETGKKGFYVLNIEDNKVEKEFIELDNYVFFHEDIDLSDTSNELEALKLVESKVQKGNKNIYEIILKGNIKYDTSSLEDRIVSSLENKVGFIKVKNKSSFAIDVKEYETDKSLKGEFVRNVNSQSLDEEIKNKVLTLGLKLLNGEEID